MNFHIGQKVVCVDDLSDQPEDHFPDENWPVVGQVYTIRDFADEDCIRLEEVINGPGGANYDGPGEIAFDVEMFRPAVTRKTSIAIFERILRNVNEPIDA